MLKTASKQNKFALTFGLCSLAAFFLFLPFLIVDKGFFLYAGDFNSQQITFSYYINAFLEEGGGSFSWATDLGSGFVNSYSFYLLGSPFFWLGSAFPAAAQPYLMVPLLCLKFGTAGAGAYLWLRRYLRDENYAVLGGALYALSGFMIYNVFFNHFVDVAALFPYELWALDETVYRRRRGVFPFVVAVNLLCNYFFFVGQIVFLFIYFACKCLAGEWRLTRRLFGVLAFESLLGCGLGCFLAWPAVLSLANNPRTIDFASGFGFLLYGHVQQYFAILASLFFPPDPPYLPAIFSEGVIKWTSLSAYLPAVGCAGVLAFLRSGRGSFLRRCLLTCAVFALVPVLNSSFYALNSSYYARWFYMPVLLMCAATVKALESPRARQELPGAAKTAAVCTAAFAAFALVPREEDGAWSLGVVNNQPQFWLSLALALGGLALFWGVYRSWQHSARLPRALLALTMSFACLFGVVEIAIGKFAQWDNDALMVQRCYREARALELPDDGGQYYRTDSYGCYDNLALWLGHPSLQFFNSTVAPSILEFYPAMGVTRDVNSKPEIEQYALRGLLGVRYLLCDERRAAEFCEKADEGWQAVDQQGGYILYENENWLPLGLSYEHYITEEQLEAVPKTGRAAVLCKAVVLDEETAGELLEASGAAGPAQPLLTPLGDRALDSRSYSSYQADAAERRAGAVSSFTADSRGFTAMIDLPGERLVQFSVPWDAGFTATVNGKEVPVYKVSHGLMAVRCPAGESEIRFTYRTPGLAPALAVAVVCAMVYTVYLALLWRRGGPRGHVKPRRIIRRSPAAGPGPRKSAASAAAFPASFAPGQKPACPQPAENPEPPAGRAEQPTENLEPPTPPSQQKCEENQ